MLPLLHHNVFFVQNPTSFQQRDIQCTSRYRTLHYNSSAQHSVRPSARASENILGFFATNLWRMVTLRTCARRLGSLHFGISY